MPAILLFGRRTLLGGDDLHPAAGIALVLRIVQLIFLLVPIVIQIVIQSARAGGLARYLFFDSSEDPTCHNAHIFGILLFSYAGASTIYVAAAMCLEYKIAQWSSVGTPTQTEPRNSKVSHLLELKLVPFSIVLLIIIMAGFATVAYAPQYYRCLDESTSRSYRYLEDSSLTIETGHPHLWWIAFAVLLITQCSEILVSTVYLSHLCRQPPVDLSMPLAESHHLHHNHELVEEMWADRCAAVCQCLGVASCFMFGGREILGQAEFGDVARALADYLETRGVLDVVPSDIITGFLVLQRLQRSRMHRARRQVLQGDVEMAREPALEMGDELLVSLHSSLDRRSSEHSVYRFDPDGSFERRSRALLSRHNFDDMVALEEGARYAKYALAIYTWVLYIYVHPCTGIPRLLTRSKCSSNCDRREYESPPPSPSVHLVDRRNWDVGGDNIFQTHKAALLLHAGLHESDLIYANFNSGFEEIPYAIMLDHGWRSVVVSVRGTFSLEDCVTDVLIDPESLEQLGEDFGFDGTDQYCHGGVLACVMNIYRDLQRHGFLEQLLLGEHALYPDYTLRLVGHSLGAATCTVLSYMLRRKFPSLRCVCYSPPGCALTWKLATECKEWCSTFVLDSDLVPRLSIKAMETLRDEILEIIGKLKVSKVEVARRLMTGKNMNFNRRAPDGEAYLGDDNMDDLLYRSDEVPRSEYQEQLERFKTIQAERRQSRGHLRSVSLYPPGKMIHLVKIGEKRSCMQGIAKCLTCYTTNIGFQYTPMWIENDDLNEIVVSSTMATDHFPNRMCAMLESVASDFGLDA